MKNILKRKNKKKPTELEEEKKFLGIIPKKYKLLTISIFFAAFLVFLSITIVPYEFYGLFIGTAVMVGFIPYSISTYLNKKKILQIEDNLPAFLRDLAESRKTGMTLPQAIYKSSKVDYGALTPEVRKMSNQVSWGIPFDKVLQDFANRIGSKFTERSVEIIIEAEKSGGALADTLDSVARDAHLIKESEKERKSKLSQQAMIMYAIYFLFIAIVVSLQRLMIPMISSRGFAVSTMDPAAVIAFYKNLFFSMIIIQAVFNGMLAGQIAEGSPVIGLKHSAIFLTVGVIVSWLMIF